MPEKNENGVNFEYKEGVRYQNEKDVSYVLPNDANELDRLHLQHWVFKSLLKGNFHAPIKDDLENGIVVLDSGCGPGTWTIEMAETYKKSKFYGVDASSIFSDTKKLSNVDFSVANLAKSLPFTDNHFHFIYQRLLIFGLKDEDWTNALQELYRIVKPGGYIQLVEGEMNIHNAGPLTTKINNQLIKMATLGNLIIDVAVQLKDRLAKAGFTNIREITQDMRFNHTDKVGELVWEDYRACYSNNRPKLAKMNPEWEDVEAFQKYLDAVGEECKTNKTYGYTIHAYVAQKP